ncbi:ABC-type metal ion transport system, periplasmic component/surface adhesin [Saccharomonospora marina XMU15]|uniref:ABC-type metal ion transport system, periplasmic component/surface adhesin n=1 Tax=Saccharomonospora marina XMU15 TaxID=882083 RepID=H5X168_9PSEU|nr:zinc ABC transporter substrate-binding protein [Saccharomonospora marina]EHR53127.1 ABC-type metal ion transport system, periplasmic component/surface adhesin [Saccharomonospora marina XMU15]
MRTVRPGRLAAVLAGLLALVLGLAACGGGSGSTADDGRISVVASTNVWGSVVSAVAGEAVQVRSLIDDPSGDPHSYQASAEDAADVQSAQLLVYNGGGYDDFFTQLADRAPDAQRVVAYQVAGSPENEHVWYDLPAVARVADDIAARLGELDPEQRQVYENNAKEFSTRLDGLLRQVETIAATHAGAPVVAMEPVADHLIERAELDNVTPPDFSEAVENETDIPVAAQQEITDLVSRGQVRAVINNKQTVSPATDRVIEQARGAGVPVVGVTETLPEGGDGYIAWMSEQVGALSKALGER